MDVVRQLTVLPFDRKTVLTLGTFDGVHRGHMRILDEVVRMAKLKRHRSILLTFDPHPREIVRKNSDQVQLLTTIDERIRLLERIDLDVCLVIPFTRDLSLLQADEFFHQVLLGNIGLSHLVVGEDHAFGQGRTGKIAQLTSLAETAGVQLTVVPKLMLEGEKVSSTSIRKSLVNGEIEMANALLGRPYAFTGLVQRGDGLGRTLGFPTANVHVDHANKLIPGHGVYLTEVFIGAEKFTGMMNIGTRPTVAAGGELTTLEVHILDFDRNIYGMSVEVHLLKRIRSEQKFASLDELKTRLDLDRDSARRFVKEQETTKMQLT
jgi:riboflavin kinase / FMN adenylyltransferase